MSPRPESRRPTSHANAIAISCRSGGEAIEMGLRISFGTRPDAASEFHSSESPHDPPPRPVAGVPQPGKEPEP